MILNADLQLSPVHAIMSKRVMESTNDHTGNSRRNVQSYQPGWMAHWMCTSGNSKSGQPDLGPRDDGDSLTLGLEASRPMKEPEMIETNTETESLRTSAKSLANEAMSSSVMKHGEDSDEVQAIRPIFGHNLGKAISHSESECFRDCNTSLLLDSPSMNDYHLPKIGQELFQKKNEQKISHYDHYTLHKMPNCVHDMETMRICTTVDSVEAVPGGLPRFSQTTHSLLITKKTDVNILKENDMFRRLVTKMNGNPSSDVYNILPLFGQANRGVKLQPLSSSSNSGEIGIGTSKVATKNESSAETDTLDMDFFKEERPNSGENSTRSTKGFNFDIPRLDVGSSREVGQRRMSTPLPDMNLELPSLPAAASSSENAGHSLSRTQSLEMDVLLAHAEQPTPKSNLGLDDSSIADPTTRWVKRLKLSTSGSSSRGTKSSNLPENSYHGKKHEFFRKILKNSISSSKSTPRKHHDEDEHLTLDPAKKGKELLFSHAWIKRWLHNGSQISQKKPEALVVCESQSSKLSMDELQKKQFPSIAAMALMGKAMGGFQSCELKKGDSVTVWNTKAF